MTHKIFRFYHFSWFFLVVFSQCSTKLPQEVAQVYASLPQEIDFNLHIRPILADRCWACHGPDKNARKANLRLDTEEGAFAALESGEGKAFVKGNLSKSLAFQRMISHDPEKLMPPAESNLSLSPKELALIAKWIEQGAEWKEHWAFIAPEKPQIPALKDKSWKIQNPIDHFIYEKLEEEKLSPNPEADKERLLRRVYLDLTGLPPSISAMDQFLADKSPNAYEKVVDRLLQSDAYAERMAMEWMDVARYADSHGMHADGWRNMWPWRDWVIRAFKKNMPYDQFVTWQLAGDLLPKASKEQILATAFHRNHPMTAEGGVIDEEFRLLYVFDRTNTTATAFLGLTMECARCHDHKYDPISQKEYYQMSAFFNQVKELGMTGDDGDYGPLLLLSDEKTDKKIASLDQKIKAQEKELQLTEKELSQLKEYLEKTTSEIPKDHSLYLPFESLQTQGAEDKNKLIIDNHPDQYSYGKPTLSTGKFGNALEFDDEYDLIEVKEAGLYEMTQPFSVSLWVNTYAKNPQKTQTLIGNSGDKNGQWRGWDLFLDSKNRLSARLIHCLPTDLIQVTSQEEIPLKKWTHVAFSYDGSGKAKGLKLFINGKPCISQVEMDNLYKSITPIEGIYPSKRPLRIARSFRAFTGEYGIFMGKLDEIKLFERKLSASEIARLSRIPQLADQKDAFAQIYQAADYQKVFTELTQLRHEKLNLVKDIDAIMVMQDMPKPRPTFVLNRGQYDAPLEKVQAATPNKVFPFPKNLPPNRLGLAQWLFAKENPLTARVTVNRYWQLFFGQGLVKTPHDFGVQGNLPTHPKLLDWLAVEFRESGWDVKKLHKLIVLSATYRQSSIVSKEKRDKDPTNLYLARGASFRLSAETIRDNALAASGLLVRQVGGKSVKPYQPEGLWTEKANFSQVLFDYYPSKGDSLYRRSMYTFIRRTSPHPAMNAFDAPNRDVCTVKRENTNTPLQALVLLNDPQFVEAARVLAERMQKEGGKTVQEQINYAFRLVTGRKPKAKETALLTQLCLQQKADFEKFPQKAQELLSIGEYPRDQNLDQIQTAALAAVANTLLSHDEAYMRR
ncbi:MAG: DUF1553 domain-containing protein [Microscillaceae bacterium]|nr:DUF1553 domain-containing protein [Microscillaceae bacterium]